MLRPLAIGPNVAARRGQAVEANHQVGGVSLFEGEEELVVGVTSSTVSAMPGSKALISDTGLGV